MKTNPTIKTRASIKLFRKYSFFLNRKNGNDVGICNDFVSKFLDIPASNSIDAIKVSFASKNPKEKNWKKLELDRSHFVKFKDKSYPLCSEEAAFLNERLVGKFFWLKIEISG